MMQPAEIAQIVLNAVNIFFFAFRIATKTPFRLPIWRWNYPHRYQVFTLTCGILSQSFNMINKFNNFDMNIASINWSSFGGVAFFHLTFAGLAFASLYRYERLHLEVKGSRSYNILRAMRISIVILILLTLIARFSDRYIRSLQSNNSLPTYFAIRTLEFSSTLCCWIIDISSSALMIATILRSMNNSSGTGIRMTRFVTKLKSLFALEVLLAISSAFIYSNGILKLLKEDLCVLAR